MFSNFCSFLNLFQINIVSESFCCFGCPREDSEHFVFKCPLYINLRRHILRNNLSWLPDDLVLALENHSIW